MKLLTCPGCREPLLALQVERTIRQVQSQRANLTEYVPYGKPREVTYSVPDKWMNQSHPTTVAVIFACPFCQTKFDPGEQGWILDPTSEGSTLRPAAQMLEDRL